MVESDGGYLMLYYVDDVGRVLAPVLLAFFAVHWSFKVKWWLFWTFRALFLFMWTSTVTKILLAIATALAPPRELDLPVQLLNIAFWWIWVSVALFLNVSFAFEQRRARVAAVIQLAREKSDATE